MPIELFSLEDDVGESIVDRFQILALSGGGYRGLYTAKVIANIEEDIKAPIATKFDLIAGTSVGGILALALALEIPAKDIVDLFVKHGDKIFKPQRWSFFGIFKALYSNNSLKNLLSDEKLFGESMLGSLKHPVIIPAINYTTGKPVIFKTPHHKNFKTDHQHKITDIALATSAAPAYFPRHVFDNNQYVDGGLFANAPGILALHEAENFFEYDLDNIHLLSVGTMSSKFTVDPRKNRDGGTIDWGGLNPANTPKKLFGLSISVQESLTDYMLKHRLKPEHYMHIDEDLTDQRANAVSLDKVDIAAQEVLQGSAVESAKICLGNSKFNSFMEHKPKTPVFYYGEHSNSEKG
ncbi:CBASS cGAMP-activated phospholipase [Methylomonas sp. MO1]|uniref:CBASS cGAMP-activated phospholipase n=1 Tax=Methylomonas sp. MO1 TaxID=3073619 RepID=UPI0028A47D9F|nr:CBASS cGAMP-activated phospholipase [Methylomonas sp. MO1]MDT4291612.1 CBASS cGAMP-activated phospholipase [Methylomonas sp. MO1]